MGQENTKTPKEHRTINTTETDEATNGLKKQPQGKTVGVLHGSWAQQRTLYASTTPWFKEFILVKKTNSNTGWSKALFGQKLSESSVT